MVRVPRYTQDVRERPALQQQFTVRANPDDFGAAIGRGMQRAGQGLQQASEAASAVRDLEDVAAAKEADNALADWSREALYGEGGFMLLDGKAAVDSREKFEKRWEERRLEIGKGLRGGASRRYLDASDARRQQVLQSTAVHTANARKSWFKQSSDARMNTFAEDALAAYDNPARVNLMLAAGQAELRQQAELLGWDADMTANAESEFLSGVHKSIALRMAIDDPIAAKAYADENAPLMTGPHQYDLELALEGAVKEETAKQEAARIVDAMNSGEDIDVEAELNSIEDDDTRILAEKRIGALLATQTAASEATVTAAKSQLWSIIDQGGTPDDVPFEVRQLAGMTAISSAWTFVEKRANRMEIEDDEGLLYDMRLYARSDPAEFSRVDLNAYRDRLSPDTIKELTNLQAGAISDAREAKDKGVIYSSAFRSASDQLEALGLTTTGKSGKDREAVGGRIAQFQNALSQQMDEFFTKEERQPTDAEVQDMINRLLLPVVMRRPKNTGEVMLSLNPFDLLGGGEVEREGFLFEAGGREDGETVDVSVKYEEIPIDLRRGIGVDLERELGRKPSPEEITEVYESFVLTR